MRAVRFLFVVFISTSVWAATQPADDVLFKPSLDQRLRSNLATKFLANWHYKDTRIDDELSVKIFERYLDLLDPNFTFFLASDMETFAPYRLRLDDESHLRRVRFADHLADDQQEFARSLVGHLGQLFADQPDLDDLEAAQLAVRTGGRDAVTDAHLPDHGQRREYAGTIVDIIRHTGQHLAHQDMVRDRLLGLEL